MSRLDPTRQVRIEGTQQSLFSVEIFGVKRSTRLTIFGIGAALGMALCGGYITRVRCRLDAVNPNHQPPAAPQRIICLAPNISETVFALGAGDRVVGVSSFTQFPSAAARLPKVGSFYDVNLEKLVALKPDLLIIQQKHERVEALCRERGIRVLKVHMTRIQSILEGIRVLGAELAAGERAAALCARIQQDLEAVRVKCAGKPGVKVFVCVDRNENTLKGAFTIGAESYLSELIDLAGGENIFRDVQKDYFQVSFEALVARAPEIIIETRPARNLTVIARAALIADWTALGDLPAVKQGRVHVITEDYVILPGPRVAKTAKLLGALLHRGEKDGR